MFRGTRKVNESVFADNRTLILTEEDAGKYNWDDIPAGTLKINPKTGIIEVKLEGETNWVPSGVKNDGTLNIVRDALIITETFMIKGFESDDSGFIYTDDNGNDHHQVFGDKDAMVFELTNGQYMIKRNHLEIFIDGFLKRTVEGGDLEEISATKFMIPDRLKVGQTVTAKYIKIFRLGNPYPRFFISKDEPKECETGDLWIDCEHDLSENDILGEDIDPKTTLGWDRLIGTPTTLKGYGITDMVSYENHKHVKADITDFPAAMKADGGDCDTVKGRKPGNMPGDMPIINGLGKIEDTLINDKPKQPLKIKFGNGVTKEYNGDTAVEVSIDTTSTGFFNSAGQLVFPNGNRLWIV